MNFKKHWEYWAKDLVIAAVFPLVILSIHGLEQLLQAEWFAYGLKPRNLKGLLGIITSPFLHGSWNHVYNNSITMVVLGFFVLQNYRKLYPKLLLYGAIFAGFWVWISARESYHIGASGLVYVLFAFLFTSGLIRRDKRTLGTSLSVVFLYGGLVWGVFPIDPSISFEGHFWGLAAGVALAFYYKDEYKPVLRPKIWEQVGEEAYLESNERKFGKYYWDKEKHEAWLNEMREKEVSDNSEGQVIRYIYVEKPKKND